MPRPGRPAPDPEFRGYVAIELEGSPEDYDSTLDPGSPTLVQLGLDRRPPEEIERFLGKPVQVQGLRFGEFLAHEMGQALHQVPAPGGSPFDDPELLQQPGLAGMLLH